MKRSRSAFLSTDVYKRQKQFFIREGKEPRRLTGYEGYDSRQMSRMAHMEVMRDGRMLLFDYLCRDALLGNARIIEAGRIRRV